jgi:hypothetical protein
VHDVGEEHLLDAGVCRRLVRLADHDRHHPHRPAHLFDLQLAGLEVLGVDAAHLRLVERCAAVEDEWLAGAVAALAVPVHPLVDLVELLGLSLFVTVYMPEIAHAVAVQVRVRRFGGDREPDRLARQARDVEPEPAVPARPADMPDLVGRQLDLAAVLGPVEVPEAPVAFALDAHHARLEWLERGELALRSYAQLTGERAAGQHGTWNASVSRNSKLVCHGFGRR